MHIYEGFLPWQWCVFWYALALPVIAYGIIKIKKVTEKHPESKPVLAVVGAFMFILSSLKLPSVTGSCSHPTGNGLGAVIFGPAVVSVLCVIVLIFQALLLGHGGITTLGATHIFNGYCRSIRCMVNMERLGKIGFIYFTWHFSSSILRRSLNLCYHCDTTFNGISNTNI